MARCFICGSTAEIENFCKNCFRERHPMVKHFKSLVIKCCKTCPAINIAGKWIYQPTPDTIPSYVRKRVTISSDYKLKALIVSPLGSFDDAFHPVQYEVKVLAKKDKHEIEQTYEFPLQFEKGNCDHCISAKSTYYEGTLQGRGITAVVEEFIDLAIERGEAHGNFLVRRDKVKDGFDYYFTKNKFVQKLAVSLKTQFGGSSKLSRRLVTRNRQSSKELYRMTILYNSPMFFKGDLIAVGKQVYKIISTQSTITATDLGLGKSVKLSPKTKFNRLIPYTTTVSKVSPQLEVIHPTTYQSTPVKNPMPKKIGERIRVVYVDDNSVYMF